ncbi:MAG: branched-chain amino acid ABC transporter permease [Acidimicrobiia bacterium]|nr:branched-chain amino acid ABC transporter permease [Acidimicrobiia bacterium]
MGPPLGRQRKGTPLNEINPGQTFHTSLLVDELLQYLIGGLSQGAIYGMVGVGFVMIYNVTGVVNFAQGEFVMVGAMVASTLMAAGWSLPLVFVGATLAAAALGALTERVAIAPARDSSTMTLIIITIGVTFALEGAALLVFGASPRRYPPFSEGEPIDILGAAMSRQSLWVLGFAALVSALLWWFFGAATLGKAMRATEMDPMAARLQGIHPGRMSLAAFTISTAIAGAAGVVLVPITSASYDMGVPLALKGFTAAVVGGLVSAPGAVVGGLLLGAIEFLAAGYISSGTSEGIAFAVLFLVLVLRPSGLVSTVGAKRV